MPLKTRSEEIQSAYQNAVNSGESLPPISGGKMGKMVFLGNQLVSTIQQKSQSGGMVSVTAQPGKC